MFYVRHKFGIREIWQAGIFSLCAINLKVRSLGSIIYVKNVFRDRSIIREIGLIKHVYTTT